MAGRSCRSLERNRTIKSLGPKNHLGFGPTIRRGIENALKRNTLNGTSSDKSDGYSLVHAQSWSNQRAYHACLNANGQFDSGGYERMFDVYIQDGSINEWRLEFMQRLESANGLRPDGVPGRRVLASEWRLTRNGEEDVKITEGTNSNESHPDGEFLKHWVSFTALFHRRHPSSLDAPS